MVCFSNVYDVQVLLPDCSGFLIALSQSDVRVRNLSVLDELTITLQVDRANYHLLDGLVRRYGGKLKTKAIRGWRGIASYIGRRAWLIGCIIVLAILTIYIPTKIFFISVEGNSAVSDTQILDIAQQCGLSFGVERKDIRSEQVKNALLQKMPALRWAGINTSGCCAVICVKERENATVKESGDAVQGIYAICDGVISDLTVLQGSAVCKLGEAVRSGQLLISGYTDCNLVIRAECAAGEVFAHTQRQIEGIYMQPKEIRQVVSEDVSAIKLVFGKKYINFDIGSGNYESGCGKIYKQIDLTLPGGFRLPVSMVIETTRQYEVACISPAEDPPSYLKKLSRNYVSSMMLAGQILGTEESISSNDHLWVVTGSYSCKEMIGRLQKEEIRIFED